MLTYIYISNSTHKCSYPGHKCVLVVDGNMKNGQYVWPLMLDDWLSALPCIPIYHYSPRVACMSTNEDETKRDTHRSNIKETCNHLLGYVDKRCPWMSQVILGPTGHVRPTVIMLQHGMSQDVPAPVEILWDGLSQDA